MKFKTSINCGNCVATVKNTLNALVGENNWKVDTENPTKILEITNQNIDDKEVIDKLKRIGFKAELV